MGLICRFKNGLFCLYIAHIRPSTVNLVAVHRLISAHLHIIAFALGEVLAGIAGFLLPGHGGLGHHFLKVLVLGPIDLVAAGRAAHFLPGYPEHGAPLCGHAPILWHFLDGRQPRGARSESS